MGSTNRFNRAGKLSGAGVDKKVVLGWKPRHVMVYNVTDRITSEKSELMDGDKALVRAAAGTGTYDDHITLHSDGFTVKAAAAVAGKELHYYADRAEVEN